MTLDSHAPAAPYTIERAATSGSERQSGQIFDPIALLKEHPSHLQFAQKTERPNSTDIPIGRSAEAVTHAQAEISPPKSLQAPAAGSEGSTTPRRHLHVVLPGPNEVGVRKPETEQKAPQPHEPSEKPKHPAVEGDRVNHRPSAVTAPETPARAFELKGLKNRSSDHGGADAVVRLPENFDPTKPIHLLVYNHGWRSSVKSSYSETKMNEQLRNAPPNTVLVMPEWQASPAAENSNQGRMAEPGRYRGMLQEVFDKTPGLSGKTLSDVADIGIVGHSAGNVPALTQIYQNGLEGKIKSVTLLDALYNGGGFDRWINNNIHDLSSGKKQFQNFYSSDGGTAGNSLAQAQRVREMLRRNGLPLSQLTHDDHGATVMDSSQIAAKGIVFKRTDLKVGGLGTHMSVPNLYIGRVEKAARIRN